MPQEAVAKAYANNTQHPLTPDSAAAKRMTTTELWDYTEEVLVRAGKDPPKIEKLGALLNVSQRTAKNILWDVIIQSPTQVNSFIDRLIVEELERAQWVTRCPIQTQNKKRKLDYELQDDGDNVLDTSSSSRPRSRSQLPWRRAGISTELGSQTDQGLTISSAHLIDDLIRDFKPLSIRHSKPNAKMSAEDRIKSKRATLGSWCGSPRNEDHLHSMQSVRLEQGEQAPMAFDCLQSFMQTQAGERLEALAFSKPEAITGKLPPIPITLLDRILKPDEAKAHMNSWSLLGNAGHVKSYAITAWTNHRIIWVTQYDGITSLHAAPRGPPRFGQAFRCEMPGG